MTELKVGCGLRGGVDLAKCAIQTPVYNRSDGTPLAHTVRYSTFAVDAPSKSQLVRLGIKHVLSVNLPVDVWNTCG